ncbi:MAG: TIGR03067 domain-containing protein [Planctomycetes bacterium]|nr:TIGR03067 domain-containing protein [Planctomycetota bacterium]
MMVRRNILRLTVMAIGLAALHSVSKAGDDAKKELQGTWIARSVQRDGKTFTNEEATNFRFMFHGDKLIIRGNSPQEPDKETECSYRIDAKQAPKHLEFTPANTKKAILGIYEVKGDELRICVLHQDSTEGRPTSFATKEGSKLFLIVLKKQ